MLRDHTGRLQQPTPSHYKPLHPLGRLEQELAGWLVAHPAASIPELLAAANAIATAQRAAPITPKMLRRIRERADFQALVRELEGPCVVEGSAAVVSEPPAHIVLHQEIAPDPLYAPSNLERSEPTEAQRAAGWRSYREWLAQQRRERPNQRHYLR